MFPKNISSALERKATRNPDRISPQKKKLHSRAMNTLDVPKKMTSLNTIAFFLKIASVSGEIQSTREELVNMRRGSSNTACIEEDDQNRLVLPCKGRLQQGYFSTKEERT